MDDVTPSMIIFDKATMLIATAKPEFIHDKDVLNVNGVNYNIIAHEVDEPPAIRRGKSCHNNANGEGYQTKILVEKIRGISRVSKVMKRRSVI